MIESSIHGRGDLLFNMEQNEATSRRKFLKVAAAAGAVIATGAGLKKAFSADNPSGSDSLSASSSPADTSASGADTAAAGEKLKVLTPSGTLLEIDSAHAYATHDKPVSSEEACIGIPGRKFVMVIDLSKCDGCRKCTKACQKMHFTPPDREWIKVFEMKDSEETGSYWMPKPCFHCDNPPCTKVCPVGATFKREDGIVLIDNTRCIGCRFCMAACPYSTRYFNWEHPAEIPAMADIPYTPEQGYPRRVGTAEKCDFCPDMIREGRMPACIDSCDMGALYFGDENEDAVTNSNGETVRLSTLLDQNAGYRFMEELGTKPRVYYLPPKNRRYPEPVHATVVG